MPDNISPEERLFNIIKENKKSSSSGGAVKNDKRKIGSGWVKNFFVSINSFRHGLNELVIAGQPPAGNLLVKLYSVDLKPLNRAFAAASVALAILVIYSALNSKKPDMSKAARFIPDIASVSVRVNGPEVFKPAEFYLQDVRQRDIFKIVPKDITGTTAESNLQVLTKDFNLAGIYMGEYPEVMIEDKAAKKTYFLKQGDKIKGVVVKNIFKDKVVLEYGSETIEFL
ncbi:MAG: hypothetical protein COS29_04160 [Candidatus Omnitrophica bacterium CG02_land_8_20_14_3_00__42_8]|nr:MAG: hypothetical protein COS29_04160 [Candidatus Omnitrophica bacterium CG02_land_8_20_14_3_00__42_8]